MVRHLTSVSRAAESLGVTASLYRQLASSLTKTSGDSVSPSSLRHHSVISPRLLPKAIMQRVYRRRFPACVTSLLKREEPGAEVGGVSVAGVYGDEEGGGFSSSLASPCGLCGTGRARYTCPRCNVRYCGLSCYRGCSHTACSEPFYRECVREELRSRGESEQDVRKNMLEILLRVRDQDGAAEETGMNPEALALLSRLARAQAEGRGEDAEEILHQLGQVDADEEEEEEDLVTKLSGLNLDALGEDELWALLPQRERRRFEELLAGGGIGAVVPEWRPWWEEHERDAGALVQEIQVEEEQEVTAGGGGSSRVPLIDANIPALRALCRAASPCVSSSLASALYGYAFSLRLCNGDPTERQQLEDFVALVLSVSECLGSGRTFLALSEALSAATAAASAQRRHAHPPDATLRAVAHILSGRSRSDPTGYTLSALSHLRWAFRGVRGAAAAQRDALRRARFLAGKKCQFLQAWASENADELRGLAREVWRESERVREERERMEREKRAVEEGWRRTRGGRRALIEEI